MSNYTGVRGNPTPVFYYRYGFILHSDMKISKWMGVAFVSVVLFCLASWQAMTIAQTNGENNTESAADQVSVVTMAALKFIPEEITISKGDTVEWKNTDFIPHTSTAEKQWDSGLLLPNQSWKHTFTESGEFSYKCTYHPTMTGKVIVK